MSTMPPKQTKTPNESVQEMGKEVTKESIRKTVWNYLEDNDLVQFPRPVHHRIPNFVGAATASEKLTELDVFKRAQTVKINPDKPQENARFLTMEAEKTLLVPTPRLRHGLFNKLLPPQGCGKEILRYCSTSQGLKEYSVPIGLEAKVKVDLVVLGSVAVSREGYRIGKGEGYADLEFAMMSAMGAVTPDTIVVTTVHDTQIVDIPEELMEEHDVLVDYIITDTQVIKCNRTKPRPTGIIWSKLTPEKVRQVPILKHLREKEKEAGKDVTLKDGREEEDIPEREDRRRMDSDYGRMRFRGRGGRFRRYRGGRRGGGPYRERRDTEEDRGEYAENGEEAGEDKSRGRYRRNRRIRRRRGPRRQDDGDNNEESHDDEHEEGESEGEGRRGPPRRRNMRRRRPRRREESENTGDDEEHDDFRPRRRRGPRTRAPIPTLFVGSIQRSVRVSELKGEIRGKDVNPIRVIWNGAKGYSLLQFQEMQEMEAALDALQNLEIRGRKLRVEKSNRLKNEDSDNPHDGVVDEKADD